MREKINAKNTVCIVIDIQERLVPAMFDPENIVEETKAFLKGMNILQVPVLFTEQYPKGLGKTLPEVQSICPDAGVLEKTQFSAFLPELEEKLHSLGKKNILLLGMETHICVLQTALDLMEAGYTVYIPEEGVASRTEERSRRGLRFLEGEGAKISNKEALLFQILQDSKAPGFKEISKLIK